MSVLMLREKQSLAGEFGFLLRSALKEAGVTRELLSESLGCSVDAVDSWCCGRVRISPSRLYELCSLLTMKGVPALRVGQMYQKALESHGFFTGYPPTPNTSTPMTLCVLGSLYHRKELSILQAISDHLSEAGQRSLTLHIGERMNGLLSCLELASELRVANVVLCGVFLPPDIYRLILGKLYKENIRVVLIATDCPSEVISSYSNAYAVGWSNFDLGYKATTLLLEAGHTRIGTVHLGKHEARFSGYLQALRDKGVSPDPEMVIEGDTVGSNLSITSPHFMRKLQRFACRGLVTAIFAPSEALTLAIPILLVEEAKVRYDSISFCGLAYPGWIGQGLSLPITYLCYPTEAVTRKVLGILLRLSITHDIPANERCIDVTKLASRVDMVKGGSIRRIS